MKLIIALCVELLLFAPHIRAQRELSLVENRNFWLTSNNAASLTTFSEKNISEGNVSYNYSTGTLHRPATGKNAHVFGADVQSFTRIGKQVVVYGDISYHNLHTGAAAGSMLFPTSRLKPFDIIESTDENAGDKRMETFNLIGSAAWAVSTRMSLGASVDFSSGIYTKQRDLRHTNTLMNLDCRLSAFYSLGKLDGVGCGFIYKRRTETIKFKTYGTTDKVFTTLIEYANGYGHTETYGGDGFTDSSNELPLAAELYGATAQGGYKGLFLDFSYLHQNGWYGRQSQYTPSYAIHSSNIFSWHARYVVPEIRRNLLFVDFYFNSEVLTSSRTNYRREASTETPSVTYYEYYAPTKMSDKALNVFEASFTGYFGAIGEIYKWHINAGAVYSHHKQTAYIFPYIHNGKYHLLLPYASCRRNIVFANTSLLSIELRYAMQTGEFEHLDASLAIGYEIPLRIPVLRPKAEIKYNYLRGTAYPYSGMTRNSIEISIGAVF